MKKTDLIRTSILIITFHFGTLFALPFTETNPGSLEALFNGCTSLGDVDGDGDLDLILIGANASVPRVSRIYANDGSGAYSEIGGGTFHAVSQGSTSLGDIDSDGDLDLILTGSPGSGGFARIYTNGGAGNFAATISTIRQVLSGSTGLGDLDGDGDLDLVLTGSASGTQYSDIYLNSNGFLSRTYPSGLYGQGGSVSLGDLDNDGDLDLIITGYGGGQKATRVYFNDSKANFYETGDTNLTGVFRSSTAVGDIDNDGDLDLVLAGEDDASVYVSIVYTNDGSGNFFEHTGNSLEGVRFSSPSIFGRIIVEEQKLSVFLAIFEV